jgi:hypothetical protein
MTDLRVSERVGGEIVEDADAAIARLGNADQEGLNSLDKSRAKDPSPLLSILTQGPWCAIHYTDRPDGPMSVLENPLSERVPEEVMFRYVDGIVQFTRSYVHPLATARKCIQEFANAETTGTPPSGTWTEL